MKLFYVHGTSDDDVTNSLDFFVVAHDVDRVRELWAEAVMEIMERPALDNELNAIFVVIEDAWALPIAKSGERYVPWDELALAWPQR